MNGSSLMVGGESGAEAILPLSAFYKQLEAMIDSKDDNVYYKYYDAFYILFHTGLRISEFCGLTINDIDLDNRIINIDHQLQRTSKMEYIIDSTKTKAGTRKIPMTEDVYETFRRILKERPRDLPEKMVDG